VRIRREERASVEWEREEGEEEREGQGRVVSLSRVNFKAQFPACSGEELPLAK